MRMLFLALLLFVQRPAPSALQTGTVTGRLLNQDGSPAAKVRVSAMSIPETSNGGPAVPTLMTLTETDSDGRYRLSDVPVGRYYIVAGFVDSPTYYPRGSEPSGARPVNVTINATTANIDFRIEGRSTGFIVSGRVIQETPLPVGTVLQVYISGSDGTNNYTSANVTMKPDGSFEFLRVRPGNYSLSVSQSQFFQPLTFTVSDKDIVGLEARLPWTGQVNGRVALDEKAETGPIPQFSMLFVGSNRQVNASHIPSSQTFRVMLPEGLFGFTAQVPPGFYVKSATAGEIDLLTTPLRIGPRDSPAEVVLTLGVSTPSPWVKLSGRVTGSQVGRLTLYGHGGSIEAPVAGDGSFEVPKILPGQYTVSLSPAVSAASPPVSLVVPIKGLSGLELMVPRTKEISGRVIVEDGGPLPNIYLTVDADGVPKITSATTSNPNLAQVFVTVSGVRMNQTTVSMSLQDDGTFKVILPEGRYPIKVGFPPNATPSYLVKSFSYAGTDLTKDPILISTADAAEIRVSLAPTSPRSIVRVSGRVVGLRAFDAFYGQTTVSLQNAGLRGNLTSPVNFDGSFEFAKVASGTYTAQLNGSAANVGVPTVSVIVLDRDVSGVELVIPRQREISGRVILEGRGPMPSVNIPLTAVSNTGSGTYRSTLLNIRPQPDGTFKVLVPEEERQVGQVTGMPAGYKIKSMQYGSIDIAGTPLRVASTGKAELRITITTPDMPPVKVAGQVKGLDPAVLARRATQVTMFGNGSTRNLETDVAADGRFVFPEVYAGDYTLHLSGIVPYPHYSRPTVSVTKNDVTDVEINFPRLKTITGRIVMENDGSLPWFYIPLKRTGPRTTAFAGSSDISINIHPQSNGTFSVDVPVGEWSAGQPAGLAPGYRATSITYGPTNVATTPINIDPSDNAELRVVIATPGVPAVTVSGTVSGIDPAVLSRRGVSIYLNSSGFVPVHALVSSDGSFEFPGLFPGNYSANVGGDGVISMTPRALVVGNSELKDVKITLPRQKEINGRVVLEGSIPLPRFTFSINESAPAAQSPLAVQPLNIRPDPEGRFRLMMFEGEGFLGEPNGLPPGITLKAASYGSADVLKSPLRVTSAETSELLLTLSGSSARPVSVRGTVEGVDPALLAQGQARVVLGSGNYAAPHAAIRPDGSFEFLEIFPGNYAAQIVHPIRLSRPTQRSATWELPGLPVGTTEGTSLVTEDTALVVKDVDIPNLKLSVPRLFTVSGRIVVEGGGPLPRLPADLTRLSALSGGWMTVTPLSLDTSAGSFRLLLPEGESRLNVDRLPEGYSLKSVAYGDIDLRRDAIQIKSGQEPSELRITLEKTKANPWVRVTGKVTGLPAEAGNVRAVLEGMFNLPQEVPVNSDGSFTFPQVFRGENAVRLIGLATAPAPFVFTAGANDVTGVDIVVGR